MRKIPDELATKRGGVEGVAALLSRWQADHDADDFTALVTLVREPVERMAARTLRHDGIRDPGACDDVVALVLEQLFRLGAGNARRPPAFVRARVDPAATVDPGWAYVRCIAWSRARDVARAVRRRERLAAGYATLAAPPRYIIVDEQGADEGDIERLHAAVAALDEQSRELVMLILDGKSQTVIAHVLGVCEGTVSRTRTRAIARLRAVLTPKKRAGSRRPRRSSRATSLACRFSNLHVNWSGLRIRQLEKPAATWGQASLRPEATGYDGRCRINARHRARRAGPVRRAPRRGRRRRR